MVTLTNGKKKRYLVGMELMFENFIFRNLKEIPWNYKCLVTSNQANPMMDRERGERMREILQIQVKFIFNFFASQRAKTELGNAIKSLKYTSLIDLFP